MPNLHFFLFWAIAAMTGLCAIAVVVSQNIVRSATWLLFTLGGTSAIFFLLGADFVGATQLLVYVGGTLVLLVFGVMLTAQGPFITMKTGAAEWAVSTVVGLLFLSVLVVTIINAAWPSRGESAVRDSQAENSPDNPNRKPMSSVKLGLTFLGFETATPEANLTGIDPKKQKRTRVAYLLPFEIVSVHLLVVLLGAAYLARAKRRRRGDKEPRSQIDREAGIQGETGLPGG